MTSCRWWRASSTTSRRAATPRRSRIKLGNRSTERALLAAENLSALAQTKAGFPLNGGKLETAWRDVLFTHFHDILTGSCVQDSREHAMGLYSNSLAVAQTQSARAMDALSKAIDTSAIAVDGEYTKSQSEGAGVGYGVENFSGATARRARERPHHASSRCSTRPRSKRESRWS